MYKIDGSTLINTVEDLLPVFNNNTEMAVAALNILEKKVGKLSRKMKMNSLHGPCSLDRPVWGDFGDWRHAQADGHSAPAD